MATTPSLAMIPSGYKASKLYSVLPTDGTGDFNTSRASVATRVNENGLIEEVASNVPRLDYSNGGCPSLLLEPTRTNLITYSEDFSDAYWVKASVSLSLNQIIAPNGVLDADKIIESSTNGEQQIYSNVITTTPSSDYVYSIFIKKGERSWAKVMTANNNGANFNVEDGIIGIVDGGINAKIEDYGNGWFKCSVSFNTSASADRVYVRIGTSNGVNSYQGDGTSGVYIYGAQVEQNSYATSYIKTVGTTQTRVADTATKTGLSSLIGQTEGAMFLDFNINNLENQTNDPIVLSFNSSNYIEVFNNGRVNYYDGTGNIDINLPSYGLTSGRHKFGIAYNINDVAFYIDGTLAGTDTSCSPSAKSSLYLGYTNVNFLPFISYNEVKLYNTRLSNAELIALTKI